MNNDELLGLQGRLMPAFERATAYSVAMSVALAIAADFWAKSNSPDSRRLMSSLTSALHFKTGELSRPNIAAILEAQSPDQITDEIINKAKAECWTIYTYEANQANMHVWANIAQGSIDYIFGEGEGRYRINVEDDHQLAEEIILRCHEMGLPVSQLDNIVSIEATAEEAQRICEASHSVVEARRNSHLN